LLAYLLATLNSTKVIGVFLGPREQVNQITSYMDASAIYGSTQKEALALRELTRGVLQLYIAHETRFINAICCVLTTRRPMFTS